MRSVWMALVPVLVACGSEAPVVCRAAPDANERDRWKQHLDLEKDAGFSGSVLIADSSGVMFEGDYGGSGDSGHLGVFWIASTSKAVTAAAALALVDEGKLSLHVPIATYLQDVPVAWQAVTAHHLLAHRAGMPHAYAADGIADRSEAANAILALQPAKPIGEFEYSNDGYTLLAIIMEIAAGEPFESIVRSRVFEPAGMRGAGFWGHEPQPSPVAPPADVKGANRARATIWQNGRSVANWGYRGPTGIYATTADLHAFAVALRNGRILQDSTFATMITSKNPEIGPNAQSYGYGMALRLRDGRVAEYWHAGNEDWLGHNSMLKVTGSRTYVILTNSGETKGQSWAHRIEEGIHACEAVSSSGA